MKDMTAALSYGVASSKVRDTNAQPEKLPEPKILFMLTIKLYSTNAR
jgi:hypothetical protein